jgi:hypothetical protein
MSRVIEGLMGIITTLASTKAKRALRTESTTRSRSESAATSAAPAITSG